MNTHTNYKKKDYYLDELYLCHNFYRRLVGRDDSLESYDDLIGYVKLLTNDEYFLKHKTNYYLKDENDGCICICGCNKCHSLFNVLHTPTNVGFSVGSTCIKKFFPDLYSKVKKIQNKEICIQCNEALYYGNYKGHTKNAEKDKNGNNKHLGHCISCWNS